MFVATGFKNDAEFVGQRLATLKPQIQLEERYVRDGDPVVDVGEFKLKKLIYKGFSPDLTISLRANSVVTYKLADGGFITVSGNIDWMLYDADQQFKDFSYCYFSEIKDGENYAFIGKDAFLIRHENWHH